MPVNRRLRDELAHVLAAHLRQRTGRDERLAQVKRIHHELATAPAQEIDQTALELAGLLEMEFECGIRGEHVDTPADWELQCRRLALLLSYVSLTPPLGPEWLDDPVTIARDPPRRLARGLLLAMLLSLAAWPWVGGYAFVACWILSPLLWLIVTHESYGKSPNPAWPFKSDAQWREHEPLLARLDLQPSWEASPHYRRRLPRWWRASMNAFTNALLLLVIYLFTALIWPISVIVLSFMRDWGTPAPDAATSAAH